MTHSTAASRAARDVLAGLVARYPSAYYEEHLDRLLRRGDWASGCCPFHEDQRPSLSVNLKHGGFKCHACGTSCGDVLDFHQRLTGMGFIEAAKALGAG
jgi:hypothetical protein